MSKTPFMPLWVADFLADTMDLDAAEIGAYLLLLMAQWGRDGKSLPNDSEKLRRVARCGRNWDKVWAALKGYFSEDDQGLFSKRLRLEAQNVALKREVNGRNGALGGRPKSLKSIDGDKANGSVSHNPNANRNESIPEPEPDKKEEISKLISCPPAVKTDACITHFNNVAQRIGWPQVQRLSPARKAALVHRINDCGGADQWCEAINRAALSPLLTGQNNRQWRADFDWLCKPANFTKLMEGNYDARSNLDSNTTGGSYQRRPGGSHDSMVAAFARVANREPC